MTRIYKRKYQFDENAFAILTPDVAYWLGVLFADGYINWKTFYSPQTVLAMKDREHLEKYKQFLKSDFRILEQKHCLKKDGQHSISYRINVNSRKMAEDIARYGFEKENPTQTLENSHDFWRGVIDGDGSLYVVKRPRCRHNTVGVALVGSNQLLQAFVRFLRPILPTSKLSINKHKSIFAVCLVGKAALAVIKKLNYQSSKFSLDRKRNRALFFMGESTHYE